MPTSRPYSPRTARMAHSRRCCKLCLARCASSTYSVRATGARISEVRSSTRSPCAARTFPSSSIGSPTSKLPPRSPAAAIKHLQARPRRAWRATTPTSRCSATARRRRRAAATPPNPPCPSRARKAAAADGREAKRDAADTAGGGCGDRPGTRHERSRVRGRGRGPCTDRGRPRTRERGGGWPWPTALCSAAVGRRERPAQERGRRSRRGVWRGGGW